MRNIFIFLSFFIFITGLFGEESGEMNFIILEEDDPAPWTGALIREAKFREIYQKLKEYEILKKWYEELDKNLAEQILELEKTIELNKDQLTLVEKKYDLERELRIDFQ